MKVFYINDESVALTVRILHKDGRNEFLRLEPQGSQVYEIDAPPESIPYVKRWDSNIVLLSYIEEKNIPAV